MDANERPVTPDATIDRELQALLAVDPSADFAARVRAHLADDSMTPASWFPGVLVAAGVAVVILAVIVARLVSDVPTTAGRSANDIALHESRPVALLDSRTFPPFLPFPPVRPVQPIQPAPSIQSLKPAPPEFEPEIIIDVREASALRALIRRASDGRIDLRPVMASTAPRVMDLAPLEDVSIEPIVIVPLEEGARP